jgi:hypothetical protein
VSKEARDERPDFFPASEPFGSSRDFLDPGGAVNGRPYPSYKPSGVEWLGDIPERWNYLDLKYVATANDDDWPESTAPETVIQLP